MKTLELVCKELVDKYGKYYTVYIKDSKNNHEDIYGGYLMSYVGDTTERAKQLMPMKVKEVKEEISFISITLEGELPERKRKPVVLEEDIKVIRASSGRFSEYVLLFPKGTDESLIMNSLEAYYGRLFDFTLHMNDEKEGILVIYKGYTD